MSRLARRSPRAFLVFTKSSTTQASAASLIATALLACGTTQPPEVVDQLVPAATARATPRRPPREEPVDTSVVLGKGPFTASANPALLDPSLAVATAPSDFRVLFRTSAGNFAVDCHREWAPNGADRLYNLVRIGFFDDVAFYRVVSTPSPFVAQFGISGDPAVSDAWKDERIAVDPVVQTNARGTLTFAMAGAPTTRTTQLFLNLADNARLDGMGFAPVCAVADDGMAAVDRLYGGYGERATGKQSEITARGNTYLRDNFTELDYVATARIVPVPPPLAPLGTAAVPSAELPPAPNRAPSAAPPPSATTTSTPPRLPPPSGNLIDPFGD